MKIAAGEAIESGTAAGSIAALSTAQTKQDNPRRTIDCLEDVNRAISRDLSADDKKIIKDIILRFSALLPKKDEAPRQTHVVSHHINTGEHAPIKSRYNRRYAPAERDYIAAEVKKMQDQAVIQPSESPWNSPVVLVKKKW